MASAKRERTVWPRGMRATLSYAFVLMSCIPLVLLVAVIGWFVFPFTRELWPGLQQWFFDPRLNPVGTVLWLVVVAALTILLALLGQLYVTARVTEPVIRISREATKLADLADAKPHPGCGDEIEDLSEAIGRLKRQIHSDMQELNAYGERSTQINRDMHSRMLVLTSVLQIGELMGSSVHLDVLLDTVVERVSAFADKGFSFLCLQPMSELAMTLRHVSHLEMDRLTGFVFMSTPVVIDADHPAPERLEKFWMSLGKPALVIEPILIRGRLTGMLGLGTHRAAQPFTEEEREIVRVFARQAAIALEQAQLAQLGKAQNPRDELTGVYTDAHIRQRLDDEIQRAIACRRPCSVVAFRLDRVNGEPEITSLHRALQRVSHVLQEGVREIDLVGRLDPDEFLLVLPELNKREAMEVADRLRQRVEETFRAESMPAERWTISGSVAENPLDGTQASDLLDKCHGVLTTKSGYRNMVLI